MATAVYARAVAQENPSIAARPAHAPALTQAGALVVGLPAVVSAIAIYNDASAAAFVHLYDKATAPTVGTDVPVLTIGVPTKASVALDFPAGIGFKLGIGWATTAAAGDGDSAAASVTANLAYYN